MGFARHWRVKGRLDLSAQWRAAARRILAELDRLQTAGRGERRWWRLVTLGRLPRDLRFDAIQTCLLRGWHPGDAVYRLWPAFGRFEVVRLTGRRRCWANYVAEQRVTKASSRARPANGAVHSSRGRRLRRGLVRAATLAPSTDAAPAPARRAGTKNGRAV